MLNRPMLPLALVALVLVLGYAYLPDCFSANCRRPLVWRWRRFDDGKLHALCGKCARHVDRIRAARTRKAA